MPAPTPTAQSRHFSKTALELGHITIGWSRIEHSLDEIIALLTPLPLGQVTDVVAGNLDFRGKIQALKGLAFLRHDDKDWLHDMVFLLDHIDNNLRPARNSAIHARWARPSRKMIRITKRTTLRRPQAREMVLETEQATPVSIAELRSLNKDIESAWLCLFPLLSYMMRDDPPVWPTASPAISYKLYLQWAPLGNPLRNVRSRLERQRKSSQASPTRPKPPARKSSAKKPPKEGGPST